MIKERKGVHTDLIVVREVVVGDSNSSGTHYRINKSISTIRERVMVNPNVAGTKNGNGIPISHSSPAIMGGRATNHGIARGLAIMDVKAMDDHVGHKLNGNASTVGNVDVDPTPIDGLKAVHDELLLQRDHHVPLEHNPQRPILDHRVAERAGLGVHRVVVVRVADHVVPAVATAHGVASEPNATVGQPLPAEVPARVTPPAVVNWIPCCT